MAQFSLLATARLRPMRLRPKLPRNKGRTLRVYSNNSESAISFSSRFQLQSVKARAPKVWRNNLKKPKTCGRSTTRTRAHSHILARKRRSRTWSFSIIRWGSLSLSRDLSFETCGVVRLGRCRNVPILAQRLLKLALLVAESRTGRYRLVESETFRTVCTHELIVVMSD